MHNDNVKNENGTDENSKSAVRIIANFMGWVDSPYPNLPNKVYNSDLSIGKLLDQFKYNESWDDLMPVCRKIRDLLNSIPRPSQNHGIYGDAIEVDIYCAMQSIDLQKTHTHVVKFIQWWNTSEFTKAVSSPQLMIDDTENVVNALLASKAPELLNFLESHYRYLNLDDQQKAQQLIESCRLS